MGNTDILNKLRMKIDINKLRVIDVKHRLILAFKAIPIFVIISKATISLNRVFRSTKSADSILSRKTTKSGGTIKNGNSK